MLYCKITSAVENNHHIFLSHNVKTKQKKRWLFVCMAKSKQGQFFWAADFCSCLKNFCFVFSTAVAPNSTDFNNTLPLTLRFLIYVTLTKPEPRYVIKPDRMTTWTCLPISKFSLIYAPRQICMYKEK